MNVITIDARPISASPLPRIRGLMIAGSIIAAVFVFGACIWAVYAPLENAAHASGVVAVESNRKRVQHLEGGIIGAILVHDGEHVSAGQTLIRLDDTKPRTTLAALQGELWDALAREARLIAERDGAEAPQYPESLMSHAEEPAVAQVILGQNKIFQTRRTLQLSKTELIKKKIAQTDQEIVGLRAQEVAAQRRIGLINEEIGGVRQLFEKGLAPKPRLLSLQRDLADIEGRRGDTVAQIARAQQTIAEAQVTILNQENDTQNEVAEQLRDTQKKMHELREQIQEATDVLARIEIRAPEEGIVTDLHVHTPGGVITAGEALLDLVPPRDRLIVEAQLRPEDIDVVRPGLPAQIRLTPFKQRRTAPVEGTVQYVSADRLVDKHTNQPYYAAKIAVDEEKLKEAVGIEMIPGMPAEVMIKTGETTVALYALSPVLDSFHRAFHEK
ncbi:MAG: HlyD family type I secretion periplasmic adaptor subunit [Alphaproteobacteria bacterium]|nr:HlyD family type I secretion periplasmic adaptor subunit [Alphaproteobacteria bacterium]